jgi:pseudouridine synthase
VFEDDVVLLDGHRVFPRQSHQSYLLNKPRGVTCSTRDPDGKRDLSEYLALLPDGTFPVGRLDRETTGLLLFTTDGDLATALLRPEHSTPKVYWLWLDECLTQKDPRFAGLTSGVQLHDGPAHAANASILAQTPAYTELLLTLHAGRNRQIRRMCHALDLRLVHLHRRNVGRLGLGLLPLGSLRPLRNEEVEGLWEDAGGRALVEWRRVEALRKDAEIARNLGLPFARLERWLERHPRSPLPR